MSCTRSSTVAFRVVAGDLVIGYACGQFQLAAFPLEKKEKFSLRGPEEVVVVLLVNCRNSKRGLQPQLRSKMEPRETREIQVSVPPRTAANPHRTTIRHSQASLVPTFYGDDPSRSHRSGEVAKATLFRKRVP